MPERKGVFLRRWSVIIPALLMALSVAVAWYGNLITNPSTDLKSCIQNADHGAVNICGDNPGSINTGNSSGASQ